MLCFKHTKQTSKNVVDITFKKTLETTTNIQLENFDTEHVPAESANGGVLLYIRKAINKLRPDLMIYKKRELKSVFIEIIQKDSKNMVVGCIYSIHVCNIVSSMTII